MGPSEELTADTLVSLFPAAILLESAAVISHAAEKPFRLRHLRHPLSPPPHRSASLQEREPWLKITFSSTAAPGRRHFPMISLLVLYMPEMLYPSVTKQLQFPYIWVAPDRCVFRGDCVVCRSCSGDVERFPNPTGSSVCARSSPASH